jgi:acyl carrier protein
MTSEETAIQLLASALGISESEIGRKTSIESSKAWDSLAHFRVVLALEEAIDRSLTPVEVFDLNGFENVVAILHKQ